MAKQLIIRKYKDDDKFQVLELLNRNFEKQQHIQIQRNEDWWNWKYENNIFGKPIIYVAEDRGKIVGVRPFWPWKLNIRGKEIDCYQPLDSAVDKEYRGKGIFTELTKKALIENRDKIDLIFNFPNSQSLGVYLKLGWTYVGKLEWYVKINKVYDTYKLIKNKNNLKSYKLNSKDLINKDKISYINIKDSFNFDGRLKTLKTKNFLIWRYLEHPQINYGMNIIEKQGKKLAYIFEVNQNEYGKELIVLDYFGEMKYFEDMLSELDQLCKIYDIAFISIINKSYTSKKILIKNLYFKQKRKNFVVLPLTLELENLSSKYKNWDMFLGLHDSV